MSEKCVLPEFPVQAREALQGFGNVEAVLLLHQLIAFDPFPGIILVDRDGQSEEKRTAVLEKDGHRGKKGWVDEGGRTGKEEEGEKRREERGRKKGQGGKGERV
jgi:hypothetical protein